MTAPVGPVRPLRADARRNRDRIVAAATQLVLTEGVDVPMSVVARRAKREAPADGGWNIFLTTSSGTSAANPVINTWLGSGCEKANVGWPCDAELEDLRTQMAFARTMDERKMLAEKIQKRAAYVVPYIIWGQWTQPIAYRADRIDGIVPVTGLSVLWNIERKD